MEQISGKSLCDWRLVIDTSTRTVYGQGGSYNLRHLRKAHRIFAVSFGKAQRLALDEYSLLLRRRKTGGFDANSKIRAVNIRASKRHKIAGKRFLWPGQAKMHRPDLDTQGSGRMGLWVWTKGCVKMC